MARRGTRKGGLRKLVNGVGYTVCRVGRYVRNVGKGVFKAAGNVTRKTGRMLRSKRS